jgi:hypothetical protein
MEKVVNDHFMYEASDDIEGVRRTFTDDAQHEVVGGPDGPLRGNPRVVASMSACSPTLRVSVLNQ